MHSNIARADHCTMVLKKIRTAVFFVIAMHEAITFSVAYLTSKITNWFLRTGNGCRWALICCCQHRCCCA